MKKAKLVALSGLVVLAGVTLLGAWWAYNKAGKTPGELMDYAEIRLQGHPTLEGVALPVMAEIRKITDEPPRRVSRQEAFLIPRLPALRKIDTTWKNTLPVDPKGRLIQVGPAFPIKTIAQAAREAKNNDTVDIESGEYYGDVALWQQKKLTIRGKNGRVRIHALNKTAEDKAIWVFRKGDIAIEGIEFVGATAYDKNGAGIRFEEGSLKVVNCLFYANETGLLVNDPVTKVEITRTEFGYNGYGDGFSHSLYVGKIGELRISESYFHHSNVGHHIKTRAKENHIYYNRITDEDGGRASYEIDFSNGGVAYVVGNIIQQSARPQNSTLISYGAEGQAWEKNELYITYNTMVNDVSWGGTFLRIPHQIVKGIVANNLFSGPGTAVIGPDSVKKANNHRIDWDYFKRAARYDYTTADENCRFDVLELPNSQLSPIKIYIHPVDSAVKSKSCIGAQ